MAKKHLLKKGVAYLLSAAMVLTSNGLIPGVMQTASAAVVIPDPIISLDFDSGTLSGNTYTEGEIGYTLTDADIVNDPDSNGNKVFYNGGGTTGFIQSDKVFADKSFSDGISIHMKVRPETQASDWNFLFGLGFNNDGWQVFDGTIGFITREWTTAHFKDYFPGGNWQPGNTLGGNAETNKYDYFMQAENCGRWYDLAYVYGKDGNFYIYVDGLLTIKYTAEAGYDQVFDNIGGNNNAIFSLGGNVFTATSNDETDKKRCNAYYDNVQIYNKVLSSEQVYKLATGKEVSSADKEALDKAIADSETVRTELYTTGSVAVFKEKLDAAKLVQNDVSADQSAVDTAASALDAAKKALVLKPVDLTSDLILDTDISKATSVIDKDNKKIIAGGYDISALGASSIGDGYIQSSVDGKPKSAGISLDKSVLDGVSLDKGFTFNIKWNFSKAPVADWWDLISIVNANDDYLMRNTVGFISFTSGGGGDNGNIYPGADCKNGFAWDSCMSYKTDVVKNLAVTVDNTGFRMYVDGVLACEKTDMTLYNFKTVFDNMAKIYIGYALIDGEKDGSLQGQFHGMQVYHRALNAAEIDKLANDGTGVSFGLDTPTVLVKEGTTENIGIADTTKPSDTIIKSVVSGDESIAKAEVKDGKLAVTGVSAGKTTVTVHTSYGQSVAYDVNVYTELVNVTDVSLSETTATIEKGDILSLIATVLPENATEKGVTWSSSDEGVATVSADGIVTAVAEGVVTIKATSNENADISASCVVTVTESSAPDNTGGPVNDESKLGTYRSDLAYKRVGVHDPSIVQDPETKKYYLFGSHCACAWSDDLENWTSFTNNITEGNNGSAHTIFKDEIEWCKKKDPNYTVTGNLWAPDVIWDADYENKDGSKGAWLMYMSINGPDWNSTISLLTSKRLDGDWTYVGPVIQSGMSKGCGVTFDYEKVTGEKTVNSRYTDNVSKAGNPTLEAHAIDPCVLYDDDGGFWMSYGSWSGGISMIKLDKKTGLRDYNTTYADTNNNVGTDGLITDPYTGYKIAGGTAVSGEGSYIEKIGDYYFLFLSYGGYAPEGGYNMRIFRSKDIKGPYKDVADKDARTVVNGKAGDTAGTTGMRLMSYYKWSFADYGYTAQGHNSATVDENGKAYVIYHNKYNDGTAAHEVRVHQLLTNEDGWILAAPFEYAGETVNKTGYSQKAFTGNYGIMLQKQNINHAKLECQAEQRITLEEGTSYSNETGTGYTGNITGDYTGTWTSKTGSPYVSLEIGGVTYKGVFCEGTIDETDIETMTFTAVGNNQECLWGYKAKDPTVAIRMTIDKVIKIPDTVATDIPLPAMGAGGSTITWKSNSVAIADDGTIPHLFNEDVKASMTATITNNGYEYEHVYEFTVLGNDRLSKGDDVTIGKLYTDNALDMSKLVQGATPKFANPFHYTHEDISGGVSISFDVTRTAASDRLSNIISFNNKLGKLYFTGGSYLGYNDFNGRFMDANLNANFAPGKDYLADNTKTNIKIEINQDGFTVYQNGTAVYSSSEVKSGTVPGGSSANNPEQSVLSWIKTAPELNFGSGNFWPDLIFKGEISNVVCAYKQKAVDVEGGSSSLAGIYTQDYESVSDVSKEWQSTSAQGNISLGREEGHGKYMSYDFTGETGTNSRGAHSYFGEGITWPDKYILDFDMALKAGNDQESQIAVLTSNAVYNNDSNNKSNENNGINTGYIFKMISLNSDTWTINGDSSKTVTIPKSEWVHFTLTGTKGQTAAHLTISNGNSELFDDDVTATDAEDIKGMYILSGRYQGVFKVDNIVVKEPSTGGADYTAYDKLMNRVTQYEAVKSIYTDESYNILTDAVAAAKSEVTNSATQDIIDKHVAAIREAINGLVRKVCTVTVAEAENGTVTGLAEAGRYMAGDSMVLKAVPSEGYDLDCWKAGEDVVSYSRKYSAMVMADITLTPVFKTADEPGPTPPPSSSEEPVVTPEPPVSPSPAESNPPSASLLPGGSTPTPKPSGNNPGGGIGGYVPSISAVPASTPAPVNTKAPEASQKPAVSPTPEASKAPVASATPAPGTDIKVDDETGAVTETTTKVDGNKTTVIEKVTTPDGVENTKETVTENFDGLTVKTETFTNSETASVLVTTVKSDAAGKVIDASAVVYTGLSDRDSKYSSKTAIPESYMQNVKEAGINNIDIYVEKPTVDAVKNNLGRKMVIKISVPDVEGVSVKNVIVTKESIDSAKEGIRKLVVKIESDKPSDCYTITIPQSELKKMDSKINVAVKTGKVSSMDSSNSKKVDKILTSNKLGKDNSYVVTIASNNTKGGIKVTTPAMLPAVKEGDKVYAYSYNKKTGKLEEIPNSRRTVIEGGEAAIEGFSGNTYVITDKELSGKNVVTLLDKAKVSVGKTSVKTGNKTKVKVNLGNGLVSKPSVNSSVPYAKQAAVVTYKSSSNKVKVSKDGTVTAKSKGKATITIKIKLAGGKVKTVKKNLTVK